KTPLSRSGRKKIPLTISGGIDNLLGCDRPKVTTERDRTSCRPTLPLGHHRCACDLLPCLESLLHFLTVCWRGQAMPAQSEVLDNRTIRGEKSLGMPG